MPSQEYSLGVTGGEFDFELPSGNTCRMKEMGVEDLVAAGLLDNFDSLTAFVNDSHIQRVKTGRPPADSPAAEEESLKKLISDPKRFAAILNVVDPVVVRAVVAPPVHAVPAPGTDRTPGALYVDSVSMTDKFAVFQRAMGDTLSKVQAMEPFRAEPGAALVGVAAGEGVRGKGKRASRSPKRDRGVLPGSGGRGVRDGGGAGPGAG